MRYVNPVTRIGGVDQVVVADQAPAPEVEEAPFDNGQYTRVNGEWAPATSSFQTLTVDGVSETEDDPKTGLTIYGTEFLDYLDALPRGVIAWDNFGTDVASLGPETGYGEIGFTAQPGRLYRVQYRSMIENNSAQSIVVRLRLTHAVEPADAAVPTTTSTQLLQTNVNLGPSETIPDADYAFSDFTYLYNETLQPKNVRVLMTMAGGASSIVTMRAQGGGAANFASPEGGCNLSIEDVGPYRAQGGAYNLGGASGAPPPTVPLLKTYTKTYTSTTAKCYMGNGSADSSQGAGDMKQGYSSYDGDSESLWIFPPFTGAIGADSISKVRLYLYANHWTNYSGGTALIKRHNYSGAPGSSPGQVSVMSSANWPRPGGRWVTLPSSVHAGIIGNTIKGFGVGPAGSTSGLYYGRFNKAGAKVEITYKR